MAKIFVFGSNTAGIHGAGAALYAAQYHGALMGCGYGHMGNSFAIPTKGGTNYIGKSLTIEQIKPFVDGFLAYAKIRHDLTFEVTRIGCGLAGHKDSHIAELFWADRTLRNLEFDLAWVKFFGKTANYWGTY